MTITCHFGYIDNRDNIDANRSCIYHSEIRAMAPFLFSVISTKGLDKGLLSSPFWSRGGVDRCTTVDTYVVVHGSERAVSYVLNQYY